MDELIMMAQAGEPLWIPIIHSGTECLNKDEYSSSFPNRIELKPVKTKSEASRESVVIFMNPTKLVEILMDVVCSVSLYLPLLLSLPPPFLSPSLYLLFVCVCVCARAY